MPILDIVTDGEDAIIGIRENQEIRTPNFSIARSVLGLATGEFSLLAVEPAEQGADVAAVFFTTADAAALVQWLSAQPDVREVLNQR